MRKLGVIVAALAASMLLGGSSVSVLGAGTAAAVTGHSVDQNGAGAYCNDFTLGTQYYNPGDGHLYVCAFSYSGDYWAQIG